MTWEPLYGHALSCLTKINRYCTDLFRSHRNRGRKPCKAKHVKAPSAGR
ncbi:hypothetical protein CPter91_4577 [Collimonas pratensis]|nr:hypothetical protein CPter91_4577 [Collimonas pratensis]